MTLDEFVARFWSAKYYNLVSRKNEATTEKDKKKSIRKQTRIRRY